jgi:hypothetical protein
MSLMPDPGNHDLLAKVELHRTCQNCEENSSLYGAIRARGTHRKRFRAESISDDLLDSMARAAKSERAWLRIRSDQTVRKQVAKLIAEGDTIQWADRSWRCELAAWMNPRRQGDGLTVPGMVQPFAQVVESNRLVSGS